MNGSPRSMKLHQVGNLKLYNNAEAQKSTVTIGTGTL